MSKPLDPRTEADLLADAERYDRWAARTDWNTEVSGNFRRLAEDARQRAAAKALSANAAPTDPRFG